MRRLFIFLLIACFSVACTKEFLDTKPSSSSFAEDGFKTVQDFESALNGCYSGLQSVGYYGRNYPVIGDVLSNNLVPSDNNLSWFVELYNFSPTSSDQYLKEFWRSAYEVIHRANTVIRNSSTTEVLDDDARNDILSQALAIRALAHFDLFKVFANNYKYGGNTDHLAIPLILDTSYIDSITPITAHTSAQVMDAVVSDLLRAKSLATNENHSPFMFCRASIQALLARVYLYKEEYRNAFLEADSVLQSGLFSLLDSKSIEESWQLESSSESIFSVKFSGSDYNGVNSLGYLYSKNGYGAFVPSKDLLAMYAKSDGRKALVDKGFCTKYDVAGKAVGNANFPVIKLSEMYLIIAEGLQSFNVYEQGSAVDENIVIQYLDEVKKRSDPSVPRTKLTGSALFDEILDEYQRELAFEGHQFFIQKRRSKGLHREDCKSQTCHINYYAEHARYALPLPVSEINTNPNIR